MRRCAHAGSLLVISVAAACAGAPRGRGDGPVHAGAIPAADAAPPAAPRPPLVLGAELEVRGSRRGALRDGDIVVSGDRIRLSIQTSERAHLYLVYCNQDRELEVFPGQGSIRTRAGEVTPAPGRGAELVLDDNTGPEALYAILSRVQISSPGQRLVKAIVAGSGGVAADCGQRRRITPPRRSAGRRASPGGPPRRASGEPAPGAPLVTIERGAGVAWSDAPALREDTDGIAVLRYRFQHVAALPWPPPGGGAEPREPHREARAPRTALPAAEPVGYRAGP